MKTLFKLLVVCLLTHNAGAQGTVLLENINTPAGINAPFYDYQGIRLAGPRYVAQLYWGNEATSLSPIGDAVPFKVNGYFLWYERTLPVPEGSPAWVQVRAWEIAGGNTYEEAKEAGVYTGVSNVLHIRTHNPSALETPADLVGLKYMGIPEPSTCALMLMGLGWLGYASRNRRYGLC